MKNLQVKILLMWNISLWDLYCLMLNYAMHLYNTHSQQSCPITSPISWTKTYGNFPGNSGDFQR